MAIDFRIDLGSIIQNSDAFAKAAQQISESSELAIKSIEQLQGKSKKKVRIDIDTKSVEQVQQAQKVMEQLNKNGQLHYLTTQEKALERLTKAWKDYEKAKGEDKKRTGNEVMRLANAYRGAGYSTDGIDKKIFEVADRIYKSYETVGEKSGKISNSMRLYSQESFEKLFSAARELGVDITENDRYWDKRERTITKGLRKRISDAVGEITSNPVEIDISELIKIKDSGIQDRIDKLKGELQKLYEKLQNKKGGPEDIFGKKEGYNFVAYFEELKMYLDDLGEEVPEKYLQISEQLKKMRDLDAPDADPLITNGFHYKKETRDNRGRKVRGAGEQAFYQFEKHMERAKKIVSGAIQPSPTSSRQRNTSAAGSKPMQDAGNDAERAGEQAQRSGQQFEQAGEQAERAGQRASDAAGQVADAQEKVNKAQNEGNNSGRNSQNNTEQSARDTADALGEQARAQEEVNKKQNEANNSGQTAQTNTAQGARDTAAALGEQADAQKEVNKAQSQPQNRSSDSREKEISEIERLTQKLEEEKKKLEELQRTSDNAKAMYEASDDAKEFREAIDIVNGIVTGKRHDNFKGLQGDIPALKKLVEQKIKEKNIAKAAAYFGKYREAGGTDKIFDASGKYDLTEYLQKKYDFLSSVPNEDPSVFKAQLKAANDQIIEQKKVVEALEEELNRLRAEMQKQANQRKQEILSTLTEQEVSAVEAYLKKMKSLQREAYNETEALAEAMDLLGKIKSKDVSGLMDQFTAPNTASNAMLGIMTSMPVGKKSERDAALRSLNPEQYDQLTQDVEKASGGYKKNGKSFPAR